MFSMLKEISNILTCYTSKRNLNNDLNVNVAVALFKPCQLGKDYDKKM